VYENISVKDTINEVMAMTATEIKNRNIELTVTFGDTVPESI